MSGFFASIERAFADFSWASAFEVAAIAVVLYAALRLLRGTTAMTVVRGMVIVVLLLTVFGRALDSVVLGWMVDNGLAVLFIVVLIVFQPEFRRALEHVGRAGSLRGRLGGRQQLRDLIGMVAEASARLAAQPAGERAGALIVIERGTGLEELAATGVRVGGAPSAELIASIFQRGSPLHDGALLLRAGEVAAARCIVPLPSGSVASDRASDAARGLGPELGIRHRAAVGISNETDALVVVVSEQTGAISLASGGVLQPDLDRAELEWAMARQGGVSRPSGRSWRMPPAAVAAAEPEVDGEFPPGSAADRRPGRASGGAPAPGT